MFFSEENLSLKLLSVIAPDWHRRDDNSGLRTFHALSYRIEGNAEFNYKDKSLTVNSGEIAFVPAYLNYNLKCGRERLIVIHFETKDKLSQEITAFKPKSPAYFGEMFIKIANSWSKKQPGYIHECKSILYKILFRVEQELHKTNTRLGKNKILDAVEYIHEHYTDNNISIRKLADMCSVSDTYFRKLFIEFYGTTPIKYINNLKVIYAKELLQSGYYTVEEVSEQCGFNNINYFSTFIKKETGASPSALMKHI